KCESYYFPTNKFLEERVYTYENKLDSLDKSFWKMKVNVVGKDTLFETFIYNGEQLTEELVEHLTLKQAILVKYKVYSGNMSSICEISDSLIYSCNQRKDETISWNVVYKDFNSSNFVNLSKRRKLISTDDTFQVYRDHMNVSFIDNNRNYEYIAQFIYQKGIGLISYKVYYQNHLVKDYTLIKVK